VGRRLGALLDVGSSEVRKRRVPHEVLSAMELTPVPVRTHDSTDEIGVVLVRSSVIDEVARLDSVSGRRNCSSSGEGDERGKGLHVGLLAYEKEVNDNCAKEVEGLGAVDLLMSCTEMGNLQRSDRCKQKSGSEQVGEVAEESRGVRAV
jgi:hypothetical protein